MLISPANTALFLASESCITANIKFSMSPAPRQ